MVMAWWLVEWRDVCRRTDGTGRRGRFNVDGTVCDGEETEPHDSGSSGRCVKGIRRALCTEMRMYGDGCGVEVWMYGGGGDLVAWA